MAKALLLAIWLVTLLCLCLFWFHPWWLPPLASVQGAVVDRQFRFTFTLVAIAFLLAQAALGLLVWRYRASRPSTGERQFRENTRAEVFWTLLTSLLFFTLAWTGARSWSQTQTAHTTADAKLPVEIEVTGMQFGWYFRYPGPDRTFGRTRPELQDASAGSSAAVGLDMSDPASQDDFVTTSLVVPVNRNVRLTLRAQDVIHSFFVPELRFKQDAVPGMAIPVVFTPNHQGSFEIVCASLCGLGHYRMRAAMKVVSESEFEDWLTKHASQTAARHP